LGIVVGRSEKLIECEYSWFSAKPILVGRFKVLGGISQSYKYLSHKIALKCDL